MAYTIDTVDVYAGSIRDRAGGVAEKMSALSDAGANLEFVIARRAEKGKGVMFCAPLNGAKQRRAAKKAGLTKSDSLRSLRVAGPDKAGLGVKTTAALADAGINLRGVSGAALGRKAVLYFAFDNRKDADQARRILRKLL